MDWLDVIRLICWILIIFPVLIGLAVYIRNLRRRRIRRYRVKRDYRGSALE